MTVKNGTLVNNLDSPVRNYNGTVTIENCTLVGDQNAFYQDGGISILKNCILNGLMVQEGSGTITLSGNVRFDSSTDNPTGIYVKSFSDGSVICHFDPTGNIDRGTVTDNGDGTWTVTKAS